MNITNSVNLLISEFEYNYIKFISVEQGYQYSKAMLIVW